MAVIVTGSPDVATARTIVSSPSTSAVGSNDQDTACGVVGAATTDAQPVHWPKPVSGLATSNVHGPRVDAALGTTSAVMVWSFTTSTSETVTSSMSSMYIRSLAPGWKPVPMTVTFEWMVRGSSVGLTAVIVGRTIGVITMSPSAVTAPSITTGRIAGPW